MMVTTLPIRVDKSHLITIGERLYAQSIELIRELVNNAYDADATEVRVTIAEDEVRVEDNGLGMNLEGLREYFTIGTLDKRINPRSPRFGRQRIGQFGIGKFATLSACERFTVATQRREFAAEVVFDKAEWERADDRWDLPLRQIRPDPQRPDGTTVRLTHLRRRFDPIEVEHHLLESVPLRAPHFAVFLNGRRLIPLQLPGHRIPILEGTPFGGVHGEIVILPAHMGSTVDMGIEIKVRQVTVRRELFGIEAWGREAARVRGEVHADFLPVTADRSGFVRDSEEYAAFTGAMTAVMENVHEALQRLSGHTERRRVRRAIREAFRLVERALEKNPDLSPFGSVPFAESPRGVTAGGGLVPERPQASQANGEMEHSDRPDEGAVERPAAGAARPRTRKPRVRRLTPNAVVQRVKIGQAGVTCFVDHFGPDATEAFHEGTTIYINRDHALFTLNARKRETQTLHITRLLTQEISLMKDPRSPRQAYERQSKLMRDALVDDDPTDR